MSTRIAWDAIDNVAALYDSVSGLAFGEVFTGDVAYEDAEHFLTWLTDWLHVDPRVVPSHELAAMRETFFAERPAAA